MGEGIWGEGWMSRQLWGDGTESRMRCKGHEGLANHGLQMSVNAMIHEGSNYMWQMN